MPTDPKARDETSKSGTSTMTVHYLEAEWDSQYFSVIYTEYPPSAMAYMGKPNPETLLTFVRDRFLANVQGTKLLSESPTSISGYPGREYVYDAQGKARVLIRAYWVKPYLYQLMLMKEGRQQTLEGLLSESGQKFLSSFQILHGANSNGTSLYDNDPLPLLSQEDMIWLGGQLMKRGIDRSEGQSLGSGLLRDAIAQLSPIEQAQIKQILAQAALGLTAGEAKNYNDLQQKMASGEALTKTEEAYSNQLYRKALTSLPKQTLSRLQALIGKGLRVVLRD
jgi:hypothetical protein